MDFGSPMEKRNILQVAPTCRDARRASPRCTSNKGGMRLRGADSVYFHGVGPIKNIPHDNYISMRDAETTGYRSISDPINQELLRSYTC